MVWHCGTCWLLENFIRFICPAYYSVEYLHSDHGTTVRTAGRFNVKPLRHPWFPQLMKYHGQLDSGHTLDRQYSCTFSFYSRSIRRYILPCGTIQYGAFAIALFRHLFSSSIKWFTMSISLETAVPTAVIINMSSSSFASMLFSTWEA